MRNIQPESRSAPFTARIIAVAILIFVAGCGSVLKRDTSGRTPSAASVKSGIAAKQGGYYLDDGPGDNPPADLASIPDAIPRDEPLRPANMRPYVALGKSYTPRIVLESYRARGVASWYGRRYHGQKTASGEVYDMYGMTAAHTTLPLPSYVRVTNIENGKSVVVRVNDRGPFLSDRLIDLSYTAAYKLDVLGGGSASVEVESILPNPGTALQVAAAPASVPNSALVSAPALVSIPATIRETSRPPPISEGPQNGNNGEAEANPKLLEAASPPQSSASVASGDARQGNVLAASPLQSSASVADGIVTADAGGIYLQLGAFSVYDNADNFLTRMRTELPSLTSALGIVARDGLFKVHAGPYPDQFVARQAADKIAQALSIKPMLLVR